MLKDKRAVLAILEDDTEAGAELARNLIDCYIMEDFKAYEALGDEPKRAINMVRDVLHYVAGHNCDGSKAFKEMLLSVFSDMQKEGFSLEAEKHKVEPPSASDILGRSKGH
jgi:hypothetical protein